MANWYDDDEKKESFFVVDSYYRIDDEGVLLMVDQACTDNNDTARDNRGVLVVVVLVVGTDVGVDVDAALGERRPLKVPARADAAAVTHGLSCPSSSNAPRAREVEHALRAEIVTVLPCSSHCWISSAVRQCEWTHLGASRSALVIAILDAGDDSRSLRNSLPLELLFSPEPCASLEGSVQAR